MGSYGPKGYRILLGLSVKTPLEWKSRFGVGFRTGLGSVSSMNYVEPAILALMIVSIALQIMIARIMARIIIQSGENLDSSVAEALNSIVENIPMGGDAVNPLQLMVMEILKGQFAPNPIQVQEVTKGSDGKFVKQK